VEPTIPHTLQRGKSKSTEPLKPIELNLERLSISPSPVEKRKAPRRSDSPSFKRYSRSGGIDGIEEPREDAEREYKRRRIKKARVHDTRTRDKCNGKQISEGFCVYLDIIDLLVL